MEVNYISKWNNYKIGNVKWINRRREHPCRELFIEYVSRGNYKSVLEIGAGECIEAKALNSKVDYTICDVSDTFLTFANETGIKTIRGCMTNIPTQKKYDLVYMCSVLEHTPDIEKTILELKRVSKNYFITMFKWRYDGGLKSVFQPRKKYFSTEFNVNKVFELFERHSTITDKTISFLDNNCMMHYDDYMKFKRREGLHRNGNYLSIIGKWNE